MFAASQLAQDKKVQKLFKLIRHYRDLEDSPKKLKGVCKDQSLRYGKDTCEEEEEEEENPEEEECEEDEEVEIMECDEEQAAKPKQSHVVMKKPAARHAKAAPAERPIPTPCRRIAAKTSVADEEILFVGENKSSKQLELESLLSQIEELKISPKPQITSLRFFIVPLNQRSCFFPYSIIDDPRSGNSSPDSAANSCSSSINKQAFSLLDMMLIMRPTKAAHICAVRFGYQASSYRSGQPR